MTEYYFFIKTDKSKERINKGKYSSKELATESFARHKKLSLSEFNKLFKVEQYEKHRTKKAD